MKRMTANEFRNLGLLQELNRRFLHPMGLALEVVVDTDTGEATGFGGVWDCRDDPEGIAFAEPMRQDAADYVDALTEERRAERERLFGGPSIQQVWNDLK